MQWDEDWGYESVRQRRIDEDWTKAEDEATKELSTCQDQELKEVEHD